MLDELKRIVYEANMALKTHGLVTFTWGNASAVDRGSGLVVIKPSGIAYEELTVAKMVVIDMAGNRVEGNLSPSSDTATHLEIYRAHPEVGAVVHTHSTYATAWAQTERGIPCYGTTHADYFHGEIPCVRPLLMEEVANNYEKNTGRLIVNEFARLGIDYRAMPAALCANHGPFVWGRTPEEAVHHAVVLEEVARMAYLAETLDGGIDPAPAYLQDKHYQRKHGDDAYYGQD